MSQPRIQLIAGPTASGKSRLALDMAHQTDAVIINADSQQLYADLRVLSARPTAQDEGLAEHRLYGVADAADAWSVGRWSRAALALLEELDGQPVIIVGGTGLYFSALTQGLADIPAVPLAVRAETEQTFDIEGEAAFRRGLAQIDPTAAAAIEKGDRQRLVRARSVATHTGRALSEWQADTQPLLLPGSWQGRVLAPERSTLYAACDARVARMVEDGALQEVERLVSRGLSPSLPAMKAVGVREFAAHLAGQTTLESAVEATRQATRHYAKRQLTWFRNQTAGWSQIT